MVYISFYADSSAQCKRGCGIGYGSMGSDTGTVIRKCIIIDKSTKTETGYKGECIKDDPTVIYSEYNIKVTKCASDGGTKNSHFWLFIISCTHVRHEKC